MISFIVVLSVLSLALGGCLLGAHRRSRARITNQEDTERTLSLLRATLESTADGILVVDTEGRMVRFNQKFVDMWHIPPAIVASGDDNQALSFVLDQLKDPERFLAKVRELYQKSDAESFDVLEFKDGRTFERYSQPQRLGTECVGRVWSFRDVTERKRAEHELARSNEELERFAQIAAHDLQNPLDLVAAFAERIRELSETVLNEKSRYYLDRIQVTAGRMRKLMEDLLAYARVASSEKKLEPVLLQDVVSEVIDDLETSIERVRGRVEVKTLPMVHADRMQMRQLFQNLIVNSLKFCRKETPPEILISCELKEDGSSEITVTDNGVGFDDKYSEEIFKPLRRLHPNTEYDGSGLGLAVCERIVCQHGGRIWAKSVPGQGASFTFTLKA